MEHPTVGLEWAKCGVYAPSPCGRCLLERSEKTWVRHGRSWKLGRCVHGGHRRFPGGVRPSTEERDMSILHGYVASDRVLLA